MSIVNRQEQYNVPFICHDAASCFERDRFQSLVFCQLSRSLVSDVRVAWGDQCLAMGGPGDDSTDQWEADTHPGSEWQQLVWVRLARIHPPHPVSGVRSPPGPENNVSHLRSAPALTFNFNFKCVMNKTSVKTTLLMKSMMFQLKVDKTTGLVYLLMSMKFCDIHGMSIYACVCPCVQLTTHLKLPPMMSFIWITEFCAAVSTSGSGLYWVRFIRPEPGYFDYEQHLQVQVQHELRRHQEDSAQEADSGWGLLPARWLQRAWEL